MSERQWTILGRKLEVELEDPHALIPEEALPFIDELARRSKASQNEQQESLRVLVKSAPVMPSLTREISFIDRGSQYDLYWREGGRITGHRASSELAVEIIKGGTNASWMTKTIVASVAVLAGAFVGLHGCIVRNESQRTLIAGAGGAGKTSVCLYLASLGFAVEVEDFTYLDHALEPVDAELRNFFTLRRDSWVALRPAVEHLFPDPREIDRQFSHPSVRQIRVPTSVLAKPSPGGPVPISRSILMSFDSSGPGLTDRQLSMSMGRRKLRSLVEHRMIEWLNFYLPVSLEVDTSSLDLAEWQFSEVGLGPEWPGSAARLAALCGSGSRMGAILGLRTC